jgi:hypothetical protein
MRRCVVLASFLGCAYHPDAFTGGPSYRFPAARATLGCVDVAVGRADQAYTTGPVVEYGFGNRCDHRVPVDLATVRVIAREPDGRDRALVAYDPRRELATLPITAHGYGRERIEYRDPIDDRPIAGAICVDVGGVDATLGHVPRWLCTGGAR